jgi:hypothetical protein
MWQDHVRTKLVELRHKTSALTPNDLGYTDYPTLARERGEEPHPWVDERWR